MRACRKRLRNAAARLRKIAESSEHDGASGGSGVVGHFGVYGAPEGPGARRPADLEVSAVCLVVCLGLAGCDRNIEPYEPGEQPSPPDLGRIFPGPPGGVGGPEAPNEGQGQTARAALPPTRTEAGAPPSTGVDGAPIQGRIEIAPELAGAQPDGGVLFVIARPRGRGGGPPLAVLRIPAPSFPLDFSIGPANVMIPSMRFAGAISLSARLDADGNAMTPRTEGGRGAPRPGAADVSFSRRSERRCCETRVSAEPRASCSETPAASRRRDQRPPRPCRVFDGAAARATMESPERTTPIPSTGSSRPPG